MADPEVLADDLLPEDAYDAGDPFELRLEVVERWVVSALGEDDAKSRRLRLRLALQALDALSSESLGFIDRVSDARDRARGGD